LHHKHKGYLETDSLNFRDGGRGYVFPEPENVAVSDYLFVASLEIFFFSTEMEKKRPLSLKFIVSFSPANL
jgi:hypothetical protein